MKKVLKFGPIIRGTNWVRMYEGAEILTAAFQEGHVLVWALVDSDRPRQERRIVVEGTGDWFDVRGLSWLVTLHEEATGYVWHVFADSLVTTELTP